MTATPLPHAKIVEHAGTAVCMLNCERVDLTSCSSTAAQLWTGYGKATMEGIQIGS
jgi:hypothetical protein